MSTRQRERTHTTKPWRHIGRAWRWSRPWVAAVSAAVLLVGCHTLKSDAVRTEYRYVTRRDSVFIDCTDTLYVEVRGDTVRIKEKVTERVIRYTVLTDTLCVADTVTVVERVMANGDCPKRKRWPWLVAGLCIGILIIFAANIIIKIYFRK